MGAVVPSAFGGLLLLGLLTHKSGETPLVGE